METANYNIWTPDNGDQYALVQDLAAFADDVDTSIRGVETSLTTAISGARTYAEQVSYLTGTTSQMNATTSRYMQVWYNTSNSKRYIGNKSGGWRRFEGSEYVAGGTWSFIGTETAGRTITINVPTVLADGETLLVTTSTAGSGFSGVFLQEVNAVTPPANRTHLTLRQVKWGNVAQEGVGFIWQVVPDAGGA